MAADIPHFYLGPFCGSCPANNVLHEGCEVGSLKYAVREECKTCPVNNILHTGCVKDRNLRTFKQKAAIPYEIDPVLTEIYASGGTIYFSESNSGER